MKKFKKVVFIAAIFAVFLTSSCSDSMGISNNMDNNWKTSIN